MKTSVTGITKTSGAVSSVFPLLCAALLALSLSGCADTYSYSAPEARYNTYHAPYYYPTTYYTPSYDYYSPYSYYEYGPRYSRTVVRSGVRYYDSDGPRYYGGYWY